MIFPDGRWWGFSLQNGSLQLFSIPTTVNLKHKLGAKHSYILFPIDYPVNLHVLAPINEARIEF